MPIIVKLCACFSLWL